MLSHNHTETTDYNLSVHILSTFTTFWPAPGRHNQKYVFKKTVGSGVTVSIKHINKIGTSSAAQVNAFLQQLAQANSLDQIVGKEICSRNAPAVPLLPSPNPFPTSSWSTLVPLVYTINWRKKGPDETAKVLQAWIDETNSLSRTLFKQRSGIPKCMEIRCGATWLLAVSVPAAQHSNWQP